MKWSIQGKTVTFDNGKTVPFEYDIKDSIELENIVVVVLEIPRGKVMTENVFGVSSDSGIILWHIERIPETSSDPENRYVEILSADAGVVRIGNWNGTVMDVNVKDGHVIRSVITK